MLRCRGALRLRRHRDARACGSGTRLRDVDIEGRVVVFVEIGIGGRGGNHAALDCSAMNRTLFMHGRIGRFIDFGGSRINGGVLILVEIIRLFDLAATAAGGLDAEDAAEAGLQVIPVVRRAAEEDGDRRIAFIVFAVIAGIGLTLSDCAGIGGGGRLGTLRRIAQQKAAGNHQKPAGGNCQDDREDQAEGAARIGAGEEGRQSENQVAGDAAGTVRKRPGDWRRHAADSGRGEHRAAEPRGKALRYTVDPAVRHQCDGKAERRQQRNDARQTEKLHDHVCKDRARIAENVRRRLAGRKAQAWVRDIPRRHGGNAQHQQCENRNAGSKACLPDDEG